jgi:hypothetical protein
METDDRKRAAGELRSSLGRVATGIILLTICAVGCYTGHAFKAGPAWNPRSGGLFASSNGVIYLVIFAAGVWLLLSGLRALWIRYFATID